jgi:hypothetical protein
MSALVEALLTGLEQLGEYLSAHVVTCLVPAFFIAGAIAAALPKETILKYFGSKAKKWLSYSVASVSGVILAVCSCTILPMFAGIYKRGAGIGPATTFLYSGPAINLLAIVLTASVLGLDLGAARAVGAIIMSIVIGLIMAAVFREKRTEAHPAGSSVRANPESGRDSRARPGYVSFVFFAFLVGILLVAASAYIPWVPKLTIVSALILVIVAIVKVHYSRDDVRAWGHETAWLAKRIFPILLIGVFITGVIGYFIPYDVVKSVFGGNLIVSCFFASIIAAALYMPTLLEVPIVGTIFGYSQGIIGFGPALALLLAGPSLSLPNMLVIWRTIGSKKTGAYIALVVVFSTLLGVIFGTLIG